MCTNYLNVVNEIFWTSKGYSKAVVTLLVMVYVVMFLQLSGLHIITVKVAAFASMLAMNGELAATTTEQVCTVSSNFMNTVELELRCFLACDEVCDSLHQATSYEKEIAIKISMNYYCGYIHMLNPMAHVS